MKKTATLALALVLSTMLLAGCRSPMDDGMTDPSTGDGSPTVSTTLPDMTLMTDPTTTPTEPSTEATTATHDTTGPSTTLDPSGTTDTTHNTEAQSRGRPQR